MNLEELRSVRNTERQRDSLQELRPSFYQEVGQYIDSLEAERDELAAESDDPFASPEVSRLTNEVETAKDVAEAIYERRMGKLVKQASLAAAGLNADAEGLTDEERALFSDLVDRIERNKAEILSVLDGEAPVSDERTTDGSQPTASGEAPPPPPEEQRAPEAGASPEPDANAAIEDGSVSAADAMADGTVGSGTPPDDERERPSAADTDRSPDAAADGPPGDQSDRTGDDPTADPALGATSAPTDRESTADGDEASNVIGRDVDRVTVQITSDVGAILGVDDREYTLSSDDVVMLPEANATPLIERDAAEPLE